MVPAFEAPRGFRQAQNGSMSDSFRIERDTMGEMQVPASALFGAHTARAIQNFPISGRRFPRSFIRALGLIKKRGREYQRPHGQPAGNNRGIHRTGGGRGRGRAL